MAKKLRFCLEMGNGVEVRSIEDLRDNFSLSRVLGYVENGKLIVWLRDRHAEDIASFIEGLDKDDVELPRKISEIFGVQYDEQTMEDLENQKEINRRLKLLYEYTKEERYKSVIESIAFDQDDLYDLLDEDVKEIYLCGDRFSIPLSKKGVSYIGVNIPTVYIDSKVEVNWAEKDISLLNVKYDENYQKIVDSLKSKKSSSSIGAYSRNSYLNFMLSKEDKKDAEVIYDKIRDEIENINYDIDADIKELKKMVTSNGIVGMANKFIEEL